MVKTQTRKDTRDLHSTPGTKKVPENVDQASLEDDPLFEKASETSPDEERISFRNNRRSNASPMEIMKQVE